MFSPSLLPASQGAASPPPGHQQHAQMRPTSDSAWPPAQPPPWPKGPQQCLEGHQLGGDHGHCHVGAHLGLHDQCRGSTMEPYPLPGGRGASGTWQGSMGDGSHASQGLIWHSWPILPRWLVEVSSEPLHCPDILCLPGVVLQLTQIWGRNRRARHCRGTKMEVSPGGQGHQPPPSQKGTAGTHM